MGEALPSVHLFRPCSHKKPLKEEKIAIDLLFMAVGSGFGKNRFQTPSATSIPLEEKGPFLLVRYLWANKENEQDNPGKHHGVKMRAPQ